MPVPTPSLNILKLGIQELKSQTQKKRTTLLDKVRKQEILTSEEEQWLDKEGNLVDEEAAVRELESVADYEACYARLMGEAGKKGMLERLGKVGTRVQTAAENKLKRKRSTKKSMEAEPEPELSSSAVFTRKENATLAQRIEILDWHHKNSKNQVKTAAYWDKIYPNLRLKQPAISAWLKDEDKWRAQWAEAQSKGLSSTKRAKQSQFPDINEMVELWVVKAMVERLKVGGELLRQKWNTFADLDHVPEGERLSLSSGWLEAMKKRCGLREYKVRSGPKSDAGAGAGGVKEERARIRGVVARYNYPLRNIFNMDETTLLYALPPDRTLLHPPNPLLTLALTTNADGTEKFPPFIISTSSLPPAFRGKSAAQLGFYYRNNAKSWMTINLYQEWLVDWDEKLRKEGRHILLLQDDFGVHRPPEGLTNIRVENLCSQLGGSVQPSEMGVIRCFKARYRERFVQRAVDLFDMGVNPAGIYDIDQLEAMRLVEAAWKEVDAGTIHGCWRKAGVLPGFAAPVPPPPPTLPHIAPELQHPPQHGAINWYDDINQPEATRIAAAAWQEVDTASTCSGQNNSWGQSQSHSPTLPPIIPHSPAAPPQLTQPPHAHPPQVPDMPETRDLSTALNSLQSRGLLNPSNRLPLEDIINPPMEQDFISTTTDEDIFRAVKEMRKDEQMREGNSGDAGAAMVKPTRKEALLAAFTIQKYLLHVNEPFARELEAVLLDLGRLSRKLEPLPPPVPASSEPVQASTSSGLAPTRITEYFTRQ